MFYEDEIVDKVYDVLKNQTNPFYSYLVPCSDDDENCGQCPYLASCKRSNSRKIGELINQYNMAFDNQAAFERLKELLRSLS
jgi:hypothetical protein